MAKKKETTETQTEVPGTPTPVTRKPHEMAPEVQEIVNRAKAQMKEARGLNKAVLAINTLGDWGLDQLGSAIERRRETLKGQ